MQAPIRTSRSRDSPVGTSDPQWTMPQSTSPDSASPAFTRTVAAAGERTRTQSRPPYPSLRFGLWRTRLPGSGTALLLRQPLQPQLLEPHLLGPAGVELQ